MVPLMDPRSFRSAPTLETDRLTLRGHTPADFDACAAMWADPLVTRHIGGRPASEEEVWARVLRYAGLWALLGFGYWVVRERATGRFVGEVGFADFRRAIEPPLVGTPEVGWALAAWAHGQGFATEAVRAAVAWGDAHLDAERTACIITAENAASLRVAGKCGYQRAADRRYREQPIRVYERWRPNAAV